MICGVVGKGGLRDGDWMAGEMGWVGKKRMRDGDRMERYVG